MRGRVLVFIRREPMLVRGRVLVFIGREPMLALDSRGPHKLFVFWVPVQLSPTLCRDCEASCRLQDGATGINTHPLPPSHTLVHHHFLSPSYSPSYSPSLLARTPPLHPPHPLSLYAPPLPLHPTSSILSVATWVKAP